MGRGIGMILEKNPMDCVREISKIDQDDTLLDAMKANVNRLKRESDQTVIGQVLAPVSYTHLDVYKRQV